MCLYIDLLHLEVALKSNICLLFNCLRDSVRLPAEEGEVVFMKMKKKNIKVEEEKKKKLNKKA